MEEFNLYAELTRLPRPHIVVPFPVGKDEGGKEIDSGVNIALVVLNNRELQDVRVAAFKEVKRRLKDDVPTKFEQSLAYDPIYQDAYVVEVLARSCRRSDALDERFFPSRDGVTAFTDAQLGVLAAHYNHLTNTRGPIVSAMTDDEFVDLGKRIAAAGNSGAFFLSSLSLDELKTFATFTACRLWSSQTASSSPGTSPEEST